MSGHEHEPTHGAAREPMSDPESREELGEVDARLRRALAAEAPAGLSDRLFAASRNALPNERPVLARLGERRTAPWAMAAALGLIFFYAAAWLNPYVQRITIGEAELATVQRTIAEPNTELDQRIDALDQRIATLSGELDQPLPTSALADGDRAGHGDLARELIELEQALGQRTF